MGPSIQELKGTEKGMDRWTKGGKLRNPTQQGLGFRV